MPKCQCNLTGILRNKMIEWYDSKKELPFVEHKPNECKCTNDLKKYNRKDKLLYLCSCCVLCEDKEVKGDDNNA